MSIQQSLRDYEIALCAAARRVVAEGQKWASDVPQDAGVYVLWKDASPVYVGETSSLRSRMRDLTRVENHTFARITCEQFSIALADKVGLLGVLSKTYTLSFILVPFGRKEVEEFLILRWRSSLFNKPTTRLMKGTQYSWVSAIVSSQEASLI
ncbi:hypothetical protein ACFFQ5_22065 [Pseudomonas brassicacearum]|uniref:hypothetical protein n=1 Tax=Pseudomonas brassicacearum TaxID=930166 RepID=UPI00087BDF61|nr:hypothetical protein [Pseudomonas brassicacearum]KAB0528556.1 hypothetical protein F7R20_03325 [Pseudomonas brassicacearum subsp. brassicacearum]NJP59225.1 hypothetical protein [Pseudomonas brassicacearum]SDP20037.1 hypothetical protein SAMN04490180_0618 [Pseudomonas brassicacearum]